jgi:hypothetical protein
MRLDMRTTSHSLEPEELMAYLDGELPSDRAARAAEHLGSCHECQDLAADIRGVSDRLLEWRVETPAMAAPQGRAQTVRRPIFRNRFAWGFAAAPVLVVVVLLLQRASFYRARPADTWQFNALSPAPAAEPVSNAVREHGRTRNATASPLPPAPLIAYTARLSLVAGNFDRSRDTLQDILKRHHGYIAQMTVNAEQAAARTLDASVKTPAAELDATIAEIKGFGRVLSEARGGEEVTQQSLDLDARLANARNTEQRLTDLLKHRTDKLADILAVENQISETRGQIEQMEAERKNLSHRIEYAKLDVRITEEYKAQIEGASSRTGTKLRNAAVEGYTGVTENLLAVLAGILSGGPLVLVWCAILFFPARYVWRRMARKQGSS